MKLPIPQLSFGKKKIKKEYFLCLILRDEQIAAYILEEVNEQLQLVSKQEETLPTTIEQATPAEWLEILDRVISKAEEVLPKDIMTHKTMFGVKEGWVEDKKIKKDYLSKLKQVCDSLDLQPIGFLVISEAIAHQLQSLEGAPLTAILVEIGKLQLTISHLRAGKIIETQHTIIVESPAKTVDALLKHFTSATVLPPRIVLFDGMNTEQIAQEFITHQWSKTLPFLHMPQIAPLPHGFDAQAVIAGAAEQMGLTVSNNLDLSVPMPQPVESNEEKALPTNKMPSANKNETLAQQFSHQYTDENIENVSPVPSGGQTVSADNLGFVEEQDVADLTPVQTIATNAPISNIEAVDENDQPILDKNQPIDKSTKKPLSNFSFLGTTRQKISRTIQNISSKRSGVHMAGHSIPRWLYILPVVLVIICLGIGWYIFSVKATVKVTLNPKIVEEKGNITFSTNSDNNFSDNTIASKDISVDLSGSASTNATGKKNVGTPAKGTVTLYNSATSPVDLSSGATITSSNNLVFTLDKDVTVASASGDVFTGTKPGTSDVTVTAKDIGTNYNLPSATTFTVNGNSNLGAKNSTAFSGGTQKQVTVVSQADLNKLAQDLPNSLQAQAKEQLLAKVSSDEALLPDITSTDLSSKTYSAKLNDPATSVTLKATVTFHQMAYSKNDLQELGKFLMKDKFTDNESLSNKGIMADVSDEKVVDTKTISANIDLKAGLLPQIDKQKLLEEITGKSVTDAQALLSQEPQVDSSDIQLQPNIPLIPKVLPRFSNHITIQIQSND